ncbi:MAG: MCE family protein [Deltaproteobacteria bacterium]|nr:MCE family protein [Deltaproteobacteria bacterium]
MENTNRNQEPGTLPQALEKPKQGISPIWLLPIIAAIIGAWLLYKSVSEAPIDVVIRFESAEGITAGKTEVMYKGLVTGLVKSVKLNPNMKNVDVRVEFENTTHTLLKDHALFWLVTPRVSITKITGLETIMSGNYIAMRPGKGKPKYEFTALSEPPAVDKGAPGLHITLIADTLPSIYMESPVYYKKMEVGTVQGYKISENGEQFSIKVHIQPPFHKLVHKGSRFWNSGGIQLEGSISGFKLKTDSLLSMLKGGIGFSTPEHGRKTPVAENSDSFQLFEDFKAAQTGIPIVIKFPSGENLTPGQTKVKIKGLEAGYVDRVRIIHDLSGVNAHVIMDPRAEPVLRKGTRFWLVTPKVSITGITGLETLTSGVYIDMQPGKGDPQREFAALDEIPVATKQPNDLRIILTADRLGSLKAGSPIYYRQVQVGEISGYALSPSADQVYLYAGIKKKFTKLVRQNSKFWNVSGINFDFSLLDGGKLQTESLESILAGGVEFATPGNDEMGKPVKSKTQFQLFDAYEDAWLEWKPKIEFEKK